MEEEGDLNRLGKKMWRGGVGFFKFQEQSEEEERNGKIENKLEGGQRTEDESQPARIPLRWEW